MHGRKHVAALIGDPTWLLDVLTQTNDLSQWRRALVDVQRIKTLCDINKTKLIFAIFPIEWQVRFGYQYPEPQKTITQHLIHQQVDYCDMAPAFRRGIDGGHDCYFYFTDPAHFNAYGHQLTAECLQHLLQ